MRENYQQRKEEMQYRHAITDKSSEMVRLFGFAANIHLSVTKNIRKQIATLTMDDLISKTTNINFHNLTNKPIPPCSHLLLGLSTKFCIENRLPKCNLRTSFQRLTYSTRLKAWLLAERKKGMDMEREYIQKLHVKGNFQPPYADWLTEDRLSSYKLKVLQAYAALSRSPKYNLNKLQRRLLTELREQRALLIINTDKNLGPAILDRNTYIMAVLSEHLTNEDIYQYLDKEEAHKLLTETQDAIKDAVWDHLENMNDAEITYFERSFRKKVFRTPIFYGTPKVHKAKLPTGYYPMRPVVSTSGSFNEIASRYVDYYLQMLLPNVESYLQDSFHLLDDLSKLQLSQNTDVKILTADAVSMYTNINVTHALEVFGKYFADFDHELPSNYPTQLILTLLKIIMTNNVFRFGDLYFLQTDGTAMGTCVAVMYASLYCAYRERTLIIPKYRHNIVYYKRFIDDIFCLWRDTSTYTWQDLQKDLPQGMLRWTMHPPALEQVFLDLTIQIEADTGKIVTRTYQKPLNLHLYLPASSAHPPGVLKGLVIGTLYRYWLQNTNRDDYVRLVTLFAQQLNRRGQSMKKIHAVFADASTYIQNKYNGKKIYVKKKTPPLHASSSTRHKQNDEPMPTLYFHMEYHPRGISRRQIQGIYNNTIGTTGLFKRQIVAFSRPRNLRDLLSPSALPDMDGNNPSDYLEIL